MQVIQTLGQVTTELLDSVFRKLFIKLNHLKKISAGTVLKYNPKMVARLVPVVELEYVPVVLQTVEDFDLSC